MESNYQHYFSKQNRQPSIALKAVIETGVAVLNE